MCIQTCFHSARTEWFLSFFPTHFMRVGKSGDLSVYGETLQPLKQLPMSVDTTGGFTYKIRSVISLGKKEVMTF